MGMCRRGIRAPVFGGCAAGEDGMGRIEAKNMRKKGGRIVMILTCVRYYFFSFNASEKKKIGVQKRYLSL